MAKMIVLTLTKLNFLFRIFHLPFLALSIFIFRDIKMETLKVGLATALKFPKNHNGTVPKMKVWLIPYKNLNRLRVNTLVYFFLSELDYTIYNFVKGRQFIAFFDISLSVRSRQNNFQPH